MNGVVGEVLVLVSALFAGEVELETAAGVAAQRINSFPSIYGVTTPFIVGCGYAAHGGRMEGAVYLYRLSDGYRWRLPTSGCEGSLTEKICFQHPMAVTCDEVFVSTAYKVETIMRLSIDALGPPSAPDPPRSGG